MLLRPMTGQELPRWYASELTKAFPPNECKPLNDILSLVDQGRYEVLGLFDGPLLLGYATLMSCTDRWDYLLLDYLGVTEARRNSGLGGHILALLRERFLGKSGLLTEAECPVPGAPPEENHLRVRRMAFYERCGFRPVYEMGTCGVRFQTLLLGEPPRDMTGMMSVHRAVYGPRRTDVIVPLAPGKVPPPPFWMKEGEALEAGSNG